MTRTPRPTRLGWLPLLAAPGLGVLSVMTVDSWLLLLAGASLGLAIAAILLRPRLGDLDVSVALPSRAELGQAVTTRIVVRNNGRHTTPLTLVTHRIAGLPDLTFVVDALARGGSAELVAARVADARGRTFVSRTTLSSSAPLGLVTTEAAVDLPTPMTVHPALVPVRLPVLAADGGVSTRAEADRSGVDVHGIREWRSGDDARQVHWRSTARRGRLVVLEREAPRGGSLVVLVSGPASDLGWERLVSVVASAAAAAAADGHVVSLYARQPGLAPVTSTHRVELLDWCAALDIVAVADAALVEAAVAQAGRAGTVHVAVAGQVAAGGVWATMARSLARQSGVRLEPLVLLDPQAAGRAVS